MSCSCCAHITLHGAPASGTHKRRAHEPDAGPAAGLHSPTTRPTRPHSSPLVPSDRLVIAHREVPLAEVPYAAANLYIPPGGQEPVSNVDQMLQVSESLMQPGGQRALEEAVAAPGSAPPPTPSEAHRQRAHEPVAGLAAGPALAHYSPHSPTTRPTRPPLVPTRPPLVPTQ